MTQDWLAGYNTDLTETPDHRLTERGIEIKYQQLEERLEIRKDESHLLICRTCTVRYDKSDINQGRWESGWYRWPCPGCGIECATQTFWLEVYSLQHWIDKGDIDE